MRGQPPPRVGLIAFDLVYMVLLTLVVGGPALAIGLALQRLPWPWAIPALLPSVFVLIAAISAQIAVFQRLLPKLAPGVYPVAGSPASRAWMIALVLRRIALHPWWGQVVMGSPTLRWLALTALGGKISFRSSMSSDVVLLDPGLLEVGEGVVIGAGCLLSGHVVDGDRLIAGRTVLGAGAELHAMVGVGPGCRIGAGARVRSQSSLIADIEVGDDALIGVGCLLQPGARVGAGAKLGDNCVLEHGATVAAGAIVPAGHRIAKGTRYESLA